MKISDYSVTMSSKSSYSQFSTESIRLSLWGEKGSKYLSLQENDKSPTSLKDDYLNSSEGFLKNLYEKETKSTSSILEKPSESTDTMATFRYRVIDYFLRWLLGEDYENSSLYQSLFNSSTASSSGFGGEVSYNAFFQESEETSFSGKGTVINSEGQKITFDMSFTLSRSFSAMVNTTRSFGSKLLDPLVINLDSPIANIGTQSFYFDLNCDGIEEKVTNLGKGSAFLALDRNEDGEINDGSELFGALSGDGFSDLACLDEDNNNWIDENDSIFDKLRIFSVDADGNRTLLSLKDSGVGAICLSSAETNFHYTASTSNNSNAYMRRTGIFLYENGTSGTIQQVDLASKEATG